MLLPVILTRMTYSLNSPLPTERKSSKLPSFKGRRKHRQVSDQGRQNAQVEDGVRVRTLRGSGYRAGCKCKGLKKIEGGLGVF